jgi:putative NADPH-quinone reductase
MNDDAKIRNGKSVDHDNIVSVMPEWWGGRDLSPSVLKVFFIHFKNTTFIAEIGGQMVGFLIIPLNLQLR